MSQLLTRPYISFLALALSAWFVFIHLGDYSLLTPDEGRNAEVAREMKVDHSWLVPTYDGATYLDKPAFFFKAAALSLSALGDTEFAARLPSALFGFGLVVITFLFCRRVYDPLTAGLTVLITASLPLYFAFSKIVIFDMTLAFFVSGAIFAAYLAEEPNQKKSNKWYWLATISAGIATLVKGPVGFLVPLIVMTCFNLFEGRTTALKRFFRLSNILLFLGIVLPWFIGLSLACPDFPYYGIMKESIARFTTTEFRRTQPAYFYALIIASCFFPWSLLLPESILHAWKNRSKLKRPDRLFILWILTVVIFFSLSQSKLPGYILSTTLAFGALLARVFAHALTEPDHPSFRILRRGALMLALSSGLLSICLLNSEYKPSLFELSHWLKPDITERFSSIFPRLTLSFGIPAILGFLAFFSKSTKLTFAAFISLPLLILTLGFGLLPKHADIKSAKMLVQQFPESLWAESDVACINCMPSGLPFYIHKKITIFTNDGSELTSNYVMFSIASGKPWPDTLVPISQMELWLHNRKRPVVLIANQNSKALLEHWAEHSKINIQALGSNYWSALIPANSGK